MITKENGKCLNKSLLMTVVPDCMAAPVYSQGSLKECCSVDMRYPLQRASRMLSYFRILLSLLFLCPSRVAEAKTHCGCKTVHGRCKIWPCAKATIYGNLMMAAWRMPGRLMTREYRKVFRQVQGECMATTWQLHDGDEVKG